MQLLLLPFRVRVIKLLMFCFFFAACRRSKKLTEYEKWEYKQLKMAGVLDVREYPLFDEEGGQGLLAGVDEVSPAAATASLRAHQG
jgi:hypothetical protein